MPRVGNDWPSSRVPEGLPSSLNSMVAAVAADGNDAIANSPTTPPISQSFITHNLPKRAQGPLVPLSAGDITGTGRTEQTIYHGILTRARRKERFLRKISMDNRLRHVYEYVSMAP